jgi:hypothetical protein
MGLVVPEDASKLPDLAGQLFQAFYQDPDGMRASVIAATALGYQTRQQRETIQLLERALAARFTHLPASELHEAAAALRCTLSRYSWYVLAVDLELSAEQAGRAATSVVRALLRDLEERNEAHGKRSATKPQKSSSRSKKPKRKA